MDTVDTLDQLGFFQDNYYILDIGCGQGYVPKYLMRKKKNIWYLGIDVLSNNIHHCRNVCRDIRCKFKWMPIQSSTYNPNGKIAPENFTLDMAANSVDSVICHSLFTHLDTEEVAKRYLSEIKRVLKPGGFLWTTWFASPPNDVSDGTRRTVYPLAFIHDQLAEYEPIYLSGGETTGYHDQLEIACVKG